MLALRSKGIDQTDFQKRFGVNWLEKNKDNFKSFVDGNFIEIKKDFIRFTKNGYAICDEILGKLL